MGSRTSAREISLQVLYQLDVRDDDIEDAVAAHLSASLSKDVKDYAHKLVKGVCEYKDKIDSLIEASSENWSLKRMALVDRNILRLSIFEMLYCEDIPHKVAIDEAVELGKKFGAKDSGAFINGILDKISKETAKRN
ncbi:MAG: transcription antitermination factor NusB [Deltaproteobacteria bacterium]|nr:transcription antitermination factor NusB [Deltaproteobacteria bacterium]